jgi:hypothetical protein
MFLIDGMPHQVHVSQRLVGPLDQALKGGRLSSCRLPGGLVPGEPSSWWGESSVERDARWGEAPDELKHPVN